MFFVFVDPPLVGKAGIHGRSAKKMDAREIEQMEALWSVLWKYGLESDVGSVWVMGVKVGDVEWIHVMTVEEIEENGLTGSVERYEVIQQGEYVVGSPDTGETNWYRQGE